MPPRTRAKKNLENIDAVKKNKTKTDGKIVKRPRMALADKTNSLSDDNASIDIPIKTSKVTKKNKAVKLLSDDGERPLRDRRLPKRYVENHVLHKKSPVGNKVSTISATGKSLTKTPAKENKKKQPTFIKEPIMMRTRRNCRLQSDKEPHNKQKTPTKHSSGVSSPFKTPNKILDSSLIANRPKRISRLPSKFEDHSTSPNKFIPIVPFHASTPIVQKEIRLSTNNTNKSVTDSDQEKRHSRKNTQKNDIQITRGIQHHFAKSQTKNTNSTKQSTRKDEISPDTNNNPKDKKTQPKRVITTTLPPKLQINKPSPKSSIKTGFAKRILEKSLSFRVFEDRKSQENNKDVYEFTFDPNEEPPPKKKRKKVVKRKPPKPKTVILSNNYEKNVQKALDALKSKVKPSQTQNRQAPKALSEDTHSQIVQAPKTQPDNASTLSKTAAGKIQIIEDVIIKQADHKTNSALVNESAKSIHMSNYASVCVEDIAADFDVIDDINYSPVNSPYPKTPQTGNESPIYEGNDDSYITVNCKDPLNLLGNNNHHLQESNNPVSAESNKDPLNLQGESFFEDQPVASSSMNVSVRHPSDSPWRVDFNNLPIKWQANTYVKANMTPAVESSFINSADFSKKKHVYTNLVAEEPLPRIEEPPNLKQTNIMSFMKEVAERSLNKKRGRSLSPTKANSLFEDSNSNFGYKTPKKAKKDNVLATPNASNSSNDKSCEKIQSIYHIPDEITNENHENSKENTNQDKSQKKQKKNKDCTFFGFDDSEIVDQENVSPIKNICRTRAKGLQPKSRVVLKEINTLNGPTRAVLPITQAKLASSDVVEKLYNQLKSADNAPTIIEEKVTDKSVVANDESSLSDEGQSVHLFEDIEVVHHLKPQRKSYGKAKKVTFQQQSSSDSEMLNQLNERSSDGEDLDDLSFHLPNVKEKKVHKKKPKKQLSKKEEKEVEEWAAGFNSMCEDIEEFPLVVE